MFPSFPESHRYLGLGREARKEAYIWMYVCQTNKVASRHGLAISVPVIHAVQELTIASHLCGVDGVVKSVEKSGGERTLVGLTWGLHFFSLG